MESSLQEKPAARFLNRVLLAACLLVIAIMYQGWGNTTEIQTYGTSAFRWMTSLWRSARIYGGTTLSFGWLVPVLALVLLWRDRTKLRALSHRTSWLGFALVLLALFAHWMGLRAQQTRLSLLALAFLLWAISFYLYGWPTARRTLYPCALLIFCVPLNFLDALTFPLMRGAAALAAGLLNGLGLPVIRQGSLLLPHPDDTGVPNAFSFDGADPAGSLGLLLLLAMGTVFWAGWQRRPAIHLFLLLAMLPLVHLVANALRLVTAVTLQSAVGSAAATAFNGLAAKVMVVLTAALLLALIEAAWQRRKKFNLWKLLQPEPPSIG